MSKLFAVTITQIHGEREDTDIDDLFAATNIRNAIRQALRITFDNMNESMPQLSKIDVDSGEIPMGNEETCTFRFMPFEFAIKVEARLIPALTDLEKQSLKRAYFNVIDAHDRMKEVENPAAYDASRLLDEAMTIIKHVASINGMRL
jgi:hypothetical protein